MVPLKCVVRRQLYLAAVAGFHLQIHGSLANSKEKKKKKKAARTYAFLHVCSYFLSSNAL